jgi:hypothetical protein
MTAVIIDLVNDILAPKPKAPHCGQVLQRH